jgi:hypothetical protein
VALRVHPHDGDTPNEIASIDADLIAGVGIDAGAPGLLADVRGR